MGSFVESTPRGSWGPIFGKLGATGKLIPWEDEAEKSARGGDENGVGGGGGGQGCQRSCSERGGIWLGLPSLLHSPNFHPPAQNQITTSSGGARSRLAAAQSPERLMELSL